MRTLKFHSVFLSSLFCITLFCFPEKIISQVSSDSSDIYHITTTDNNEYTGKILLRDSSKTIIKTMQFDSLILKSWFIKKIEKVNISQLKNGKVWLENPQSARYFWAPNGYGLKKGEAYYQNVWIFFNQVSVGLTKNFSLGFGMIPTFLIGAADAIPVWLTPKLSFPVVEDKIHIGAGVMYINIIGLGSSQALVYGISTFGSKDKNISIGFGYGYSEIGLAKRPAINVSGLLRTGPRGYLITENYYIGGEDNSFGLIMVGGRTLIKRIALDYGLAKPFTNWIDMFIAIPWLGITVPFGKK